MGFFLETEGVAKRETAGVGAGRHSGGPEAGGTRGCSGNVRPSIRVRQGGVVVRVH